MLVRLDFRSGVPIYAQIVEQVKHLVAAGRLRPGEQLPTVRQLATELRVNFNTVARAYQQLDEEGIISTQQGRGTYVLERPAPLEMKRLRREKLTALIGACLAEARRLEYSREEVRKAWEEQFADWKGDAADE